jgi:hypothetical protein
MSRNNTNNHNNNNQNSNQNKNNQTVAAATAAAADAWTENLKRNQEQRMKDRKWFNMQPGEKTVIEFLPEFGPVYKDFDGDNIAETLRYEYKVIDINHRDAGPKPWDVSKRWSESIDYHLKQGHHVLKVERVGTGMKTNYFFTPVDAANSTTAASSS